MTISQFLGDVGLIKWSQIFRLYTQSDIFERMKMGQFLPIFGITKMAFRVPKQNF